MATKITRAVLFLALAAALLASAGCAQVAEKAAEQAIEKQTGVDIKQDGDSVTITGKDGKFSASSSGELPEGFPKDVVPVYSGTITGSMKADEGYSVVVETGDDVAAVWEWYVNEFKDGWEIKQQLKVDQGGMISAEKGDWEVQVTVGSASGSDAKTAITTFAKKRSAK